MGELVQFPALHEGWVTAQQLASHFMVSVPTIRRWTREGMPSLDGRIRRYRLRECEAWIEKGGKNAS